MNTLGPMRYLTILFCDLSCSVGLSAEMACLEYVQMLRELRALFRSAVAEHGGQIARLQGDGMLAIFSQDDGLLDGRYRAVCCALQLHASVGDIVRDDPVQLRPSLHSGLHAGLTYLEHGDVETGRFDLVGNAPNLTARLCALAGPGKIMATEQVVMRCASELDMGRRQILDIRGWPTPVPAYQVLGRAHRSTLAIGAMPRLWPMCAGDHAVPHPI